MAGRFDFTLDLSEIMSSWNKIAAEEMKAFGLKGTYVIYLIALYKHPDGLTAAKRRFPVQLHPLKRRDS